MVQACKNFVLQLIASNGSSEIDFLWTQIMQETLDFRNISDLNDSHQQKHLHAQLINKLKVSERFVFTIAGYYLNNLFYMIFYCFVYVICLLMYYSCCGLEDRHSVG